MTDKLLEGIQYRELKPEMPDYRHTEDQRYGDWLDVPGSGKGMTFATSVQFRTKPEYIYSVNGVGEHANFDDALLALKTRFSNGALDVRITKKELARVPVDVLLAERHVQYSSGANWYDVKEGFKGNIFHRIQFRVRPEVYWDVQFGDGRKTKVFHQEDELNMFVKDMLEKKQYNFSVSERVKEPNYAW